jgi:hypothetical protein
MRPDVTTVMPTDGLNAAKTAHISSQEPMRMETPDTISKKLTFAAPVTLYSYELDRSQPIQVK